MSSAAKKTFITPDEYLAFERLAEFKSEYYDGKVYAMAGASYRHNIIAVNLITEINLQLRGRPCQPCFGDVRLSTKTADAYIYPDIMVICGEPQFAEGVFDSILNPTVIIEVLSPSRELWDRVGKFEKYRTFDSLREYVLISQERFLVERFTRQGKECVLKTWIQEEEILAMASIECQISLRDIYRNVKFDAAD